MGEDKCPNCSMKAWDPESLNCGCCGHEESDGDECACGTTVFIEDWNYCPECGLKLEEV